MINIQHICYMVYRPMVCFRRYIELDQYLIKVFLPPTYIVYKSVTYPNCTSSPSLDPGLRLIHLTSDPSAQFPLEPTSFFFIANPSILSNHWHARLRMPCNCFSETPKLRIPYTDLLLQHIYISGSLMKIHKVKIDTKSIFRLSSYQRQTQQCIHTRTHNSVVSGCVFLLYICCLK